jgi:peptidoglycan/LPS O-acetylase OafA/YrhL
MKSKQGSATRAPIGRIPELDLLRFLAAASVVIYHYTYQPVLNGVVNDNAFWPLPVASRFGYLGVTLFFMISGFVILWSSQARSSGEFVISRIARLFPSFWICVLVTALVVAAARGPEPLSFRTVALNLTMIPGRFGVPFVDGVYWTLFVELKFYILIFLVLLTGTMEHIEMLLVLWLAVTAVSTFGMAPKWLASLALHPFGPYFISGCLFYLLRARGVSVFRVMALIVACGLGAAYAVKEQPEFLHEIITPLSSFVVASSVVLFHALFAAIALIPNILPPSRWWYWLGGLTYPLYLLHNRVGKIISARLSARHSGWVSLAVELVIALVAAAIIAAAVERRACGAFHKALSQMATRFRVVRHSSA